MIGKIVKDLSRLPLEQFAYYLLKQDPIFDKISQKEIPYLIDASIECGKLMSEEVVMRYGKQSMDNYFEKCGINLITKEENSGLEYIYFGTFQKPNKITIYEGNIAKGNEILKEKKVNIFGKTKLVDIVKAHEFFHFFEETSKDLFINTHKITLWSLGKFNYQSKIIALAEIASMSFAYHLLDLQVSPNVLDVLLLYPHNRKLAIEINDAIVNAKLEATEKGSGKNEITNCD